MPQSIYGPTVDPTVERVPVRSQLELSVLFMVGIAVALVVQLVFAANNGGPTALLHVGVESNLHPVITNELEGVRLWPAQGHDGKFSYAIAREPFNFAASAVDHPAYRYRRYLYSLLGGGFGLLSPTGTLYGLMLVAAIGFGLTTAASAAWARQLGAGDWSVIVGFVNLGILAGVLQLSADPLAFGLAMTGAALLLRNRLAWALVFFVLAAWSKEVYLLIPVAVAAWETWEGRWRRALLVAGVPGLFTLAWSAALVLAFPQTSLTNSAFSVPFVGIAKAFAQADSAFSFGSQVLMWTLILVATLACAVARHRLVTTLTVAWLALAIVSHEQIWFQDSIRAFAPLFTFAAAGLILSRARSLDRVRIERR